MKPFTKIVIGIVILALAVLVFITINKNRNLETEETGNNVTLTSPASAFTWRYEDGGEDSYGLSQTKIILDITYENGKVVATPIDTVQGTCNAIDPKPQDADRVAGTTKIQCYAAGFGQWYKIVKGSDIYEVHRKYFEEGNPDEAPVDHPWETVVEVPLFQ